MNRRLGGSFAMALLLVAACGGEGGTPSTYALELVSGDDQTLVVTTTAEPLVARVVDTAGAPATGVTVEFAVTSGPGTVTASGVSGPGGIVRADFTAGADTGTSTVRARIPGVAQLAFTLTATAGLVRYQGEEAGADAGTGLTLTARALDASGNGAAGVPVAWSVVSGGGTVSADTVVTDGNGLASITRTLGSGAGGQSTRATSAGGGDVLFHSTARKGMTVLSGGNNVSERYSSDLWVQGGNAYTGTWGFRTARGRVLKVWDVAGTPALVDSIDHPNAGTLSDDEVSADGSLLLVTAESGTGGANGLYLYSLADPAHPALLGFESVSTGLHTGTFADIGGHRYVFAAKDPSSPALMVFRIQPDSADKIVTLTTLGQPASYGIHDTFVRDGLAFVSDWDTGMRIYDVGDGRLGGTPAAPQLVSTIVTAANGVGCHCVHNAWWYHDADGGARYLFIGQEGPGSVGSSSSGDIHVVDLSLMEAPREVAFYHLDGAGVHNFWMDEARGILYAAYYNGGIVALDVTGTLSGDLASREIARITPGGPGSTYVWGVMLANGALWATDMLSGFWKLSVP